MARRNSAIGFSFFDSIERWKRRNTSLLSRRAYSRHPRIESLERRDLLAVTFSGQITYKAWTLQSGLEFPVRGIEVFARGLDWSGEDDWNVRETAYTDDMGNFSVTLESPPAEGSFSAVVGWFAASAPDGSETNPAYSVNQPSGLFGTAGSPYLHEMFLLPVDSDDTEFQSLDYKAQKSTVEGEVLQIFDALTTGFKTYENLPNRATTSVEVVFPASASNSYYKPLNDNIYIIDGDKDLWDIILEEYGHHIQDVNGLNHLPGGYLHGSHDPAYNLRFKGWNDDLQAGHANLAFIEGWAQYFSVWAQQAHAPSDIQTVKDLKLQGYGYNIESNPKEGPGPSLGEDNEVSVARVLWDITDEQNLDHIVPPNQPTEPDAERDHDELSHTHEWLWELVKDNNVKLLDGLWQAYQDHPDPTDQNKIDLGGIYESHNVAAHPIIATPNLEASTITFEFQIPKGRDKDLEWQGPIFNRFRVQVYDENGDPLIQNPTEMKLSVTGVQAISTTFGFTVSQDVDTREYIGTYTMPAVSA